MHIMDIMRGDLPTFSFEFFPPRTPEAAENLYQTIRDLESYMPHFVSVTYGAGGSTRDLTHDLVERIQHTTNPASIRTAAVLGSAWPVSRKVIPRRRIDWLKWIISKRKWTPAPTTSSHNYFSIIATFSISANVVRSPESTFPLSPGSCRLPP